MNIPVDITYRDFIIRVHAYHDYAHDEQYVEYVLNIDDEVVTNSDLLAIKSYIDFWYEDQA